MMRHISSSAAILLPFLVSFKFQGIKAQAYKLVTLDEWCGLCLGVDRHDEFENVVIVDCDDGDRRQLWNFDDEYENKFLIGKEQAGDVDLCVTMSDCYLDQDRCEDESNLPALFLKRCTNGGDNEDFQRFRYDIGGIDRNKAIVASLDIDLCTTYDVDFGEDPRRYNPIVLKDCQDIDNSEREWAFDSSFDDRDCTNTDEDFNLLVLRSDESLCACLDDAAPGATIKLCDCIEDDEDSIDSQLQQWRLRDTRMQQNLRPRRSEGLCVGDGNGELHLIACNDNQDLIWMYNEEDDDKVCLWTTGIGDMSKCMSPSTFEDAKVGDKLTLAYRSYASAFRLVDVRYYNRPLGRSGTEDEFKIYRLNNAGLCIGYYSPYGSNVGQYLTAETCRTSDKTQHWKLINDNFLWQSQVLDDPEDSTTSLCVTRTPTVPIYLILAYCKDVGDQWSYEGELVRAIAPIDSLTKCVTYCPDYGTNDDDPAESDPLCLSTDCYDLQPEKYEWYMEDI